GPQAGPIPRGTSVSTGDETWHIRLGHKGYCRLEVAPRSALRVEGQERAEEVYLEQGGVECDVDRGVGAFAVRTEAGVVTVTGTRFSVKMLEEKAEAGEKGGVAMAGRKLWVKVLMGAVLMTGAWGTTELKAGEEGGTVTGILASKGDTWIGVRTEGQEESTLYMPYWKGGLPKDGGGFDKDTLALMKTLVLGSKVKLVWKLDEYPRVVSVELLSLPEKKPEPVVAEKAEGEGEKVAAAGKRHKHAEGETPPRVDAEKPRPEGEKVAAAEKTALPGEGEKVAHAEPEKKAPPHREAEPAQKKGTVIGVVTDKKIGEKECWREVKSTDKEAPVEKYFPRWVGAREGGAPDHLMIAQFKKVKVNDWVRIDWVFEERRRAIKMTIQSQ
ncbi:MAG: FecR domain-containing protein, partial [Planctomycetota bacterium]|nr:FecR domain-containing protein [Planctomycetota bacterium]